MSGLINKVKDALHKDKTADDHTTSSTHNTTSSHTGAGSNLPGSHGTTATHGTSGSGLTGTGHSHNDPSGPHSSHMGNQADPRVDSDRLGASGNTAGAGGVGGGQYTSQTGTGTGAGLSGNELPKALVEDKSRAEHHPGHVPSGNTHGTHSHGGGLDSTYPTHEAGGLGQKHADHSGDQSGPHASKMANKLDPTVDTASYGTTRDSTGHSGHSHATGAGGLPLPQGSHNTHGTSSGLTGSSHDTYGSSTGGLTGGSHNTHGTSSGLGHGASSGIGGTHGTSSGIGGTHGTSSGIGGTSGGIPGTHGTSSGIPGAHGTSSGIGGTHGTSSGIGGTHGTSSNPLSSGHNTHSSTGGVTGEHWTTGGSDPNGPHHGRLANQIDPHVAGGAGGLGTNTSHGGSGLSTGHGSSGLGSGHTAPHQSSMANQADPRVGGGIGSDPYGSNASSLPSHQQHSGLPGSGGLVGGQNTHAGTHGGVGSNNPYDSTTGTSAQKPSLMDKLNPKKDADHDGKAGFMK